MQELAEQIRQDAVTVLDVRGRAEWEAGHLPGVENIPVGYLDERLDEIPGDRPVVLYCQGGTRSAIAASLLRARGRRNVVNYGGGYAEWQAAGQPVEQQAGSEALAGAR
jgi:hydroxyacylglutathione hydrolase